MNLFLPELFCQITTNLNDKEKIFLTSCSKITYNFKSLIILYSEYNLEEINDKWRAKNILIKNIKNYLLEIKILELLNNLIQESLIINFASKYIKFVSNNTNIKLFCNKITLCDLEHPCYFIVYEVKISIYIINESNTVPRIIKFIFDDCNDKIKYN